MIFIFGGAYQGKLDYAIELLKDRGINIGEEDIFTCTGTEIDFSKKIIDKIEDFCRACCEQGIEAKEYIKAHEKELEGRVIASRDVSQGLVPMDSMDREYREMMGRMMIYLSSQADEVYRVFAGLGQRLK